MRPIATALFLLLLTACAAPGPERSVDQRPEWGASPAAVRAFEPSDPVLEWPGRQVYHVERAGLPMTLTYRFDADELGAMTYFNRADHADNNEYLSDYERLKSRLVERNGLPASDRMVWHKRIRVNDESHYGDAVAAGNLGYTSRWETPEATIRMRLRGNHLEVVHELIYEPPE